MTLEKRMKREDVMADDIADILVSMTTSVAKIIELTDEEEDELWEAVQPAVEKFFNYPDYRHNH